MAAPQRIFVIFGLIFAAVSASVLLLARDGIGGIEIDSPAVDDELIERGRYLSLAGNCGTCHSSADGAFMAGGSSGVQFKDASTKPSPRAASMRAG